MLQSGVLLKEIDELIRSLRTQGPDGELKSRICALILLISHIPSRTIGGQTGLRSTSQFIIDLLVEDLADDNVRLGKRVPQLLDALAMDGFLMRIDDEYRLQTEEGAEWEQDYRGRLASIRDDAARMNQLRSERLVAAVEAALGGLKLTQGISKTPRRVHIHWSQDEPVLSEGDVPVWIRDEWSVAESAVRKSAAQAGDESPIVFVLLPKHQVDQIKDGIASFAAAEDTLRRPTPQTDEGRAAQRAMKTRLATDDERLTTLFQEIVARARVFQGGGAEITISTLREAVSTAANRSLVRLFSKFDAADNANWAKVIIKAREGAPDALNAVGHQGEPITNAARNIRVSQDGKELSGPKELPPTQISKATLYKEHEPPTVGQRLAVTGLLTAAGIAYDPGQEGAQIPALLQRLQDLGTRAGGPPPMPESPDTAHIDDLVALGGNQQFRAVADRHDRLSEDLDRWRAADQQREKREAKWHDIQRLLRHAEGLPVAGAVAPAVAAIRDGRQLLDEPDPVSPLLTELAASLRSEVALRARQLATEQRAAVAELETWDEWRKISSDDREALVAEAKLVPTGPPDISTDAKLLDVLDATSLSGWQDRISLVPGRRDRARQRAAKQLEPGSVTVTLPSATLKTIGDLEAYIDEVRARVQPHLDVFKTVII